MEFTLETVDYLFDKLYKEIKNNELELKPQQLKIKFTIKKSSTVIAKKNTIKKSPIVTKKNNKKIKFGKKI